MGADVTITLFYTANPDTNASYPGFCVGERPIRHKTYNELRSVIGTYDTSIGPIYSDSGRIKRLSLYCS